MRITQLRNATIIVHIGAYNILVDPMFAAKGALPALRLLDGRRLRNPLVELPETSNAALEGVTHCLITHCQKGHFDHLDRAGKRWLRERQVPVICTPHDAGYLRQRGLNVQPLTSDPVQTFLIIMGVDEVIAFARIAQGRVVANHLEALSHCPVGRGGAEGCCGKGRVKWPSDDTGGWRSDEIRC